MVGLLLIRKSIFKLKRQVFETLFVSFGGIEVLYIFIERLTLFIDVVMVYFFERTELVHANGLLYGE